MNDLDMRYQFSFLSMYDYKNLEDNLSKMASKGWKIDRIGGFIWKFKKTKPENRKFFIAYSSEAISVNYKHWENQGIINDSLNENDWTKETRWRQMEIFSADEETDFPEIDETTRIESVCMAMNKTFIPSCGIGFLGMLIVAFLNGTKYFAGYSYGNADIGWSFLITLYAAVMLGLELLGYIFWIKTSKKKIAKGGTSISTIWHSRLRKVLWIGFFAVVVAYLMCVKL